MMILSKVSGQLKVDGPISSSGFTHSKREQNADMMIVFRSREVLTPYTTAMASAGHAISVMMSKAVINRHRGS